MIVSKSQLFEQKVFLRKLFSDNVPENKELI